MCKLCIIAGQGQAVELPKTVVLPFGEIARRSGFAHYIARPFTMARSVDITHDGRSIVIMGGGYAQRTRTRERV